MNGRSNFYYMSSIPDSEEYILEKDVNLWNKAVWLKSTTKYKIATLELALIDFFHNKNKVLDSDDFDDFGLFSETLSVITDREKLIKIANKTKNENTIKTTENFIKWIN